MLRSEANTRRLSEVATFARTWATLIPRVRQNATPLVGVVAALVGYR